MEKLLEKLREPFAREELEFRVGAVNKDKMEGLALAYVQARAIQNRLDELFGIDGWTVSYREVSAGFICSLSIKINDRWITKEDGASMTEFSYGDIWIRYSASSKYELPFDPDSDDFKSSYDHETNFVVSMDTIQEAIKFLTAYMIDVSEAVCQCRFSTSDPDDMVMTLHLDYTGAVDYKVKMEKCSDAEYFDGQSAFIYLNSIRSAIGILAQYGVKNVNITFDSDAAAMKFSDDDGECPVFVIHTVTEEI